MYPCYARRSEMQYMRSLGTSKPSTCWHLWLRRWEASMVYRRLLRNLSGPSSMTSPNHSTLSWHHWVGINREHLYHAAQTEQPVLLFVRQAHKRHARRLLQVMSYQSFSAGRLLDTLQANGTGFLLQLRLMQGAGRDLQGRIYVIKYLGYFHGALCQLTGGDFRLPGTVETNCMMWCVA